jgi:hypothetical protein
MAKELSATTDSSAVGKITQVTGEATVTHPDGTHAKAEVGTAIHQGDVVETSAKGAVHILFADNTTFAVSESAKLSIDEYVYNPQEHSGTSFFSMLHGVFVYTSGLIGKDDPSDVKIETPVGSIGIRGTVVAGDINAAGEPSTITVVDGAIVVTNGGGSITLSDSYDTATLTSYSTAPTDSGTMDSKTFETSYSSVGVVGGGYSAGGTTTTGDAPAGDGSTTTSPDGVTSEPAPDGINSTAPDGSTLTAPDGMTSTDPAGTTSTTTADAGTTTDTTTVAVADAWDPTVTDPALTTESSLMTPVSDTSFTGDSTTFGTTSTTSTTFADTSTTDSTGTSTGGTLLTTSTSTSTSTTTTSTSTTGGTGTGGTVPPPQSVNFIFTPIYTHNTSVTTDDGLSFIDLGWLNATPQNPIQIGFIQLQNISAPTFAYSGGGVSGNVINASTLSYISGTGDAAQVNAGLLPAMHFDSTGHLYLDDPLAVLASLNGNFNINVTVTDGVTGNVFTLPMSPLVIQLQSIVPTGGMNYIVGDHASGTLNIFDPANVPKNDFLNGTPGNDLMWGREGNDVMDGFGGTDNFLFGGSGNDLLRCSTGNTARLYGNDGDDKLVIFDTNFLTSALCKANGGIGDDSLQLGNPSLLGTSWDFTGPSNNVFNIEKIEISQAMSIGNTVHLSLQDVFDMTEAGGTHQLGITNLGGGFLSSVDLDLAGWTITSSTVGPLSTGSTISAGNNMVNINATFGTESVTLVINTGPSAAGGSDGINVTVN